MPGRSIPPSIPTRVSVAENARLFKWKPSRTGTDVSSTLDPATGRAQITAKTLRTDRWWLAPLLTLVGLVAWILYAVVHAFMQKWYFVPEYNYLTPFYSPCVSLGCDPAAAHFGRFVPDVWWLPYALLSLPFLGLFRFTCYYYRKAYYRAFWLSPPACAVAEPHTKYSGETRFPLILQNIHRYFWYFAMLFCVILSYDAILGFRDEHGHWGHMGLGTVILVINALLIWAYTLSCHSCRHIVGGRLRHFSRHPIRYWSWTQVSKLNAKHMQLAWVSLVWLVVADLYIFLLAHGSFTDPRFF